MSNNIRFIENLGNNLSLVTINGYKYQVYIPPNCNKNTQIHYYYPGAAGYINDDRPILNQIANQNVNSIVMMPIENYHVDVTNSAINSLAGQLGVNNNNVSFGGFSCRGANGIQAAVDYLHNHNNARPVSILSIDSNPNGYAYKPEDIELLRRNKSTVFVATAGDPADNYYFTKSVKSLINGGVDVVFIDGHGVNHPGINKLVYDSGALNFFSGSNKLGAGNYDAFRVTLDKNGNYVKQAVDVNNLLASKNSGFVGGLNDSSATICCNSVELGNILNAISNAIYNSSYLNSSFASYSGTTMVPNGFGTAIGEAFNINSSLLSMLLRLLQIIADMDSAISDYSRSV